MVGKKTIVYKSMIGVFDSGSGGLSVLSAIRRTVPDADIVYLADTANMPYGTKSCEELERLTQSGAQKLFEEGAEMIVWACNSVSAAVIRPRLQREEYSSDDMTEMVGPCVSGLQRLGPKAGKIAICATVATIQSGMYASACSDAGLDTVSIALRSLASYIEQRNFSLAEQEIRTMLRSASMNNVQTIALCCTHYPLIKKIFLSEIIAAGLKINLFDPSDSVAEIVAQKYSKQGSGITKFIVTKESSDFRAWAQEINSI